MGSDTDAEAPSLENLYREAFDRLETFPGKVIELNEHVDKYMPKSVKICTRTNNNDSPRFAGHRTTFSTIRDYDLTSIPGFDVTSYYSLSMCDHDRLRHGVRKRRYYRMRGITGATVRRRPGPLGQLLAFLVGRLTDCTRRILLAPSRYIIDKLVSVVHQPSKPKISKSCPAPNWSSSLSVFVCTKKKDETTIGNLIDLLRPAAIELIADTTTLKRWLQTTALANKESPSGEFAGITRTTETIDCWAYELFFHLKYLQESRARRTTDQVSDDKFKPNDDLAHANLWHRLVQLRDNYIILYETFHDYQRTHGPKSAK